MFRTRTNAIEKSGISFTSDVSGFWYMQHGHSLCRIYLSLYTYIPNVVQELPHNYIMVSRARISSGICVLSDAYVRN